MIYKLLPPLLLLSFCLFVLPGRTQAATTVSGNITTDTTWDTTGSPYTINANLILYPGYTLTIDPGVTVNLDSGVNVGVQGQLIVAGTEASHVTITGSVNPTSDWMGSGYDGIDIDSDQGGSISATYMDISHLHTAIQIDCCYASGLEFIISHSVFSDNTVGLFGYDGPGTVVVDHTTFSDNTYAVKGTDISISDSEFIGNTYGLHQTSGVSSTCNSFTNNDYGISGASDADVSYSTFTNNGTALDDPWSSLAISYNSITNNTIGLYTESSGTSFANNNIYSNTTWNAQNGSTSSESLVNNWWNTTALDTISATIRDAADDTGVGVMTIDPVLIAAVDSSASCVLGDVTLNTIQKDAWNKTITLSWTNPTDSDFDHVQITRTDIDGNEVVLAEAETGTSYLDTSIDYGMTYTYALSTVDTEGNVSEGVTTVPKKVRSPHIHHLRLTARGTAITARWERLPLRRDPAAGYIMYYGTEPDALTNVLDVGNSRMITIPELVPGHMYYFAVAAYNSDGLEGSQSVIKSILL